MVSRPGRRGSIGSDPARGILRRCAGGRSSCAARSRARRQCPVRAAPRSRPSARARSALGDGHGCAITLPDGVRRAALELGARQRGRESAGSSSRIPRLDRRPERPGRLGLSVRRGRSPRRTLTALSGSSVVEAALIELSHRWVALEHQLSQGLASSSRRRIGHAEVPEAGHELEPARYQALVSRPLPGRCSRTFQRIGNSWRGTFLRLRHEMPAYEGMLLRRLKHRT